MRSTLAVLTAWLITASVFFALTRHESEIIEFRDIVFARLGISIPSDILPIHTGKADCWYE